MTDQWEKALACSTGCNQCHKKLKPEDQRILSIYSHQAICTDCKKEEEKKSDYASVSKRMIETCMIEAETSYGDAGGYCYYHFYPFDCKT